MLSHPQVESLFYSQASSVTEFSAYRSYKYYGFTMAFLVKLKQGTNDSIIAEAYQSLVSARRLGYQYLRYNRESRVVRAFLPSRESTLYVLAHRICVCIRISVLQYKQQSYDCLFFIYTHVTWYIFIVLSTVISVYFSLLLYPHPVLPSNTTTSAGCKAFSEMPDNFTQFVQICQQTPSSNCICANINPVSHIGTMSPSNAV